MRGQKTLEKFHLVVDWLSSIDHLSPDVLQIFVEPVELILDLVGQLSSVTEDQC